MEKIKTEDGLLHYFGGSKNGPYPSFPSFFEREEICEKGERGKCLIHAEVLGVIGASGRISEVLKVDGVPPSLGPR